MNVPSGTVSNDTGGGSGALVGIDVGGTFTDVVYADPDSGRVLVEKVASTPADPADGVRHGLHRLRDDGGVELSGLAMFVHGSTIATNAMLENKLGKTALIVTRGFADMLEIGTQIRHRMFDLQLESPRPLVARDMVIEVDERIDRTGTVVHALSEGEIRRLVDLVQDADIDACAICLLFSFRNDSHEQMLAAALRDAFPRLHLALSSEVSPIIKEYQRSSTTATCAALQPRVSSYLFSIENALAQDEVGGAFYVMQSSGGMASASEASRAAHRMLLSGPAGGVIAATRLAERTGRRNLITFDVGGTSTDICLIHDGRPRITRDAAFEGRPLRDVQVDIHTIGSGGGSLARVDSGGLMRVGPQSAGATPGPACYGRGGTRPAVTDAHLVLGRIDPDNFLGGEMALDRDAAVAAIETHVATRLGVSVETAAAGILDVADAVIARGIRTVSINRGHDPREFDLVAFGGAGPMHAASAGRLVGLRRAVVPRYPGIYSAVGLISADVKHHVSRPIELPLSQLSEERIREIGGELVEKALAYLRDEVSDDRFEVAHRQALQLRYLWQDNAVEVPVDLERLDGFTSRFHELHDREFGYSNPSEPLELVSIDVETVAQAPWSLESALRVADGSRLSTTAARSVLFPDEGWLETPVLDRAALAAGFQADGPCIVEEREATTIVPPGSSVSVDEEGNLIVEIDPTGADAGGAA